MRSKTLLGPFVLALPLLAHAQDGLPPAFSNLPMDNMMLDNLKRNLNNATGSSGHGQIHPNARRPVGTKVSTQPTTFASSPVLTRQTIARYVAWAKLHSPKAADELARSFAKVPPARIWQGIVRQDDVRSNDLADVYGEYWATMWSLATGQSKTSAQTRGLIEQFRPMIASPRRPMTDAGRQTMAEDLMLDTIQVAFYAVGIVRRNDQAASSKLRDAAAARFRQNFGMDARSLRLTDRGLARA